MMIGIRRAGVSETALTLQEKGFIRYKRGHITIADEKALEGFVCECYEIVKAEFEEIGSLNAEASKTLAQ
jgi:hypothetical protein